MLNSSANLFASETQENFVFGTYFITTADTLYRTQELPGNLEIALIYYKKAARYSASLQEIEWKLARCYWTLAAKTANQAKRVAYYQEGIRFGSEAVEKHPGSSNAHTWLALNIGSKALSEGIVKSLYKRDMIKSGLETAITLNPKNSVALTGLATWYHNVPEFFGGDQRKAIEIVDQVIEIDPNYMVPRMYKAQFLISRQKYSAAISELNALLAVEKPSSRWEGTENKFKAQELLKILEKRNRS